MSVQVTANMIKELRDRTGVGMSKCKTALEEANGDIDEAVAYLRKSGMASAVKKEGRETKEGAIAIEDGQDAVAMVEVNAETDFVIRNDVFQKFLSDMAKEVIATKPDSLETFLTQKFSQDSSMTIDEYRATIVQTIGENIQIKRLALLPKSDDKTIGSYSHMGGKIACLTVIEGSQDEEALARDIAMHTAAEAPDFLDSEEVPAEIKAREEEIARTQASSAGKPENIIGKIVEGKLRSFFDQVCLLRQKFIKDSDKTIAQLIEGRAKETGKPLALTKFYRWKVGS